MSLKRDDFAWPWTRLTTPSIFDHWLHGDFRDVAYFYNYKLYGDVVVKGALQ